MGLFDRITTIIKSNVNDLLNKAEDPEKMINQAIVDMQENLREAKRLVANSIRDKKHLERKYKENIEQAKMWEERAELALTKNDEELAIEALKRKKSFQDMADKFKTQFSDQEKMVNDLKENLRNLEDKIEEYKRKKDYLVAKSSSVKAKAQMSKQKARISNSNIFDTFDRMEDKIDKMEDTADAYEELEENNSASQIEKRFDELDKKSGVEDELAALKAKLGKA